MDGSYRKENRSSDRDPGKQTGCAVEMMRAQKHNCNAQDGKSKTVPLSLETLGLQKPKLSQRHMTEVLQTEPASRCKLGLSNKDKALFPELETWFRATPVTQFQREVVCWAWDQVGPSIPQFVIFTLIIYVNQRRQGYAVVKNMKI